MTPDFNDSPPLAFRDINAEVLTGGSLIQIESVNQNGTDGPTIMLDLAEVIALRDWLSGVIA